MPVIALFTGPQPASASAAIDAAMKRTFKMTLPLAWIDCPDALYQGIWFHDATRRNAAPRMEVQR
jgi:hypothetical protein